MRTKTYDAIIVGSGVAGCFCALQLPETLKVLLITKQAICDCNSYLAQGGVCVLKDESDRDAFIEDTLKAGHYQNDPDIVALMVDNSREVIQILEAYGVHFDKEQGKYVYTKEGGHSQARILFHDDQTGKEIVETLVTEIEKRPNITVKEHTMMLDIQNLDSLMKSVLVKEKGMMQCYHSQSVVLATGGIGGLYEHSTNFRHITGDGLAVALKNQVAIQDVQYVQMHPTSLYTKRVGRKFLISESVRGEGACLYNAEKERFVNELLPRDVVSNAIFKQMKEEHSNHVWLSMRTIQDMDIRQRFPDIVKHCLEEGWNPLVQDIPVVPSMHYYMGGIKTDGFGKTSKEGLYAVGEVGCNRVHGKNRLASNSLLESLVFARRAAQDIAKRKNKNDNVRTPSVTMEDAQEELQRWREHSIQIIKGENKNAENNG